MPFAPKSSRPAASRVWYNSTRWRALRKDHLGKEPLCRLCRRLGRVTVANVCDHVEPHRENEAKFWSGPFQSLCSSCHNSVKQREEQASLMTRGVWD